MKKTITARIGAVVLLSAGMILAPVFAATASPFTHAPSAAETPVGDACNVTSGQLTWGVKESFRSYIQSSIAKGDWETSDGASYELPNFVWTDPSGSFNPATGAGNVSFIGTLRFTGHGGILDMVLANPTIEIGEDGTASLLLDARSNDTDGNPKVEVEQAVIANLGEPGTKITVDVATGTPTTMKYSDVPATLTAEGVPAFADFYAAGDELDPINLTVEVDCEVVQAQEPADESEQETPEATEIPEVAEATDEADRGIPWVPIAIGGAAIVAIAVAATLIAHGRKKSMTDTDPAGDEQPPVE